MAGSSPLRVRHNGVHCPSRLVEGSARYVHSFLGAWENLVAILGTTISPYLFFWQASQEVEEQKAMGRRLLVQRQGATKREIVDRKLDVGVGTFFSNFAM